jgi:hypothetical protein
MEVQDGNLRLSLHAGSPIGPGYLRLRSLERFWPVLKGLTDAKKNYKCVFTLFSFSSGTGTVKVWGHFSNVRRGDLTRDPRCRRPPAG